MSQERCGSHLEFELLLVLLCQTTASNFSHCETPTCTCTCMCIISMYYAIYTEIFLSFCWPTCYSKTTIHQNWESVCRGVVRLITSMKIKPRNFFRRIWSYFDKNSHYLAAVVWLTWSRIWQNCGSLLNSTRFSHIMSVIHLAGFGGQPLRSRAAPPLTNVWNSSYLMALLWREIFSGRSKVKRNLWFS